MWKYDSNNHNWHIKHWLQPVAERASVEGGIEKEDEISFSTSDVENIDPVGTVIWIETEFLPSCWDFFVKILSKKSLLLLNNNNQMKLSSTITEWFGLERPLNSVYSTPCHEQGHLPLSKVAPRWLWTLPGLEQPQFLQTCSYLLTDPIWTCPSYHTAALIKSTAQLTHLYAQNTRAQAAKRMFVLMKSKYYQRFKQLVALRKFCGTCWTAPRVDVNLKDKVCVYH